MNVMGCKGTSGVGVVTCFEGVRGGAGLTWRSLLLAAAVLFIPVAAGGCASAVDSGAPGENAAESAARPDDSGATLDVSDEASRRAPPDLTTTTASAGLRATPPAAGTRARSDAPFARPPAVALAEPAHGALGMGSMSGAEQQLVAGPCSACILSGHECCLPPDGGTALCCADGQYCDSTVNKCFSRWSNGNICSRDGECTSGNCVDGFCCNGPCNTPCYACSTQAKGYGNNGVCEPQSAGKDSHDDCVAQGATSCGTTGVCNGLGACAQHPSGTKCAETCANGPPSQTTSYTCNGNGTCLPSSTSSCGNYLCASASACAASCSSDADCQVSAWCRTSDHSCEADQANGKSCTSGSQCQSGNCVDGVCCETSCTGTCVACSAAKKGGGDDGVCGNVAGGTDPDFDCDDDGAGSCKHDGTCNGQGSCRFYAQGTSCGSTQCQGNLVKGQICDGIGNCTLSAGGTDCAPYLCQGTGCTNPCAADSQCVSGNFCDQGQCEPKGTPGQTCAAASECGSGFCIDGFCCDQACGGQCQACDVANKEGKCSPVVGAPHGGRSACAGTTAECAGACDGVNAAACTYPGATKSCGTTSCAGETQTGNSCDGQGSCQAGTTTTKCGAYKCDGTSKCKTACTSDDDCSTGFGCNGGQCTPKSGAQCDGDHTVQGQNGKSTDCTPFKCEGQSCKITCSSVDDCVAPAVCSDAHLCVVPEPTLDDSGDTGGCGCRAAGADPRDPAGLAVLVFGLLAVAGRRRRAGQVS